MVLSCGPPDASFIKAQADPAWVVGPHGAGGGRMEYLKHHPAFKGSVGEQLFQTLIDTTVDGIMVIDDAAHVLVYNRACEKLFGYAPAEVLGHNVRLLMPEPYRTEHDGYVERYLKTGEKHIIGIGREVTGRRKDGSTFPMYLSVGEGRMGAERIFIGVVHDITQRVRREHEVSELQKELMHTTRLTATGQLSAALAHELNQPLTAILNYANALSELVDWSTVQQGTIARDVLEKIEKQTERAGEIIRRLRGFVEKRDPVRSPDDLNKAVGDAIKLGLVGASDDNVRLRVTLAPGLPDISFDRIQIQQVLINLLRNATEAMQNAPRRELSVSTAQESDQFVVVSVADTGSGLAKDVSARLFEPFVTTKAAGLGIGLSICRTIIEAHGGRLWTEPNAGGGTVFRFRLPVAPESAADG